MAMARGLDALLGDNSAGDEILTLRIAQIEPNKDQPRKDFDDTKLNELAESIKENGLIQPIVVRTSTNGTTYRIIAGERRYRACRIAGLREVPVIVREADDALTMQLALIENIQREDLNPVEEARAIAELLNQGNTQETLAKYIGKSRSYVANSQRLLNLPEKALEKLAAGEITPGHAKALLGLTDEAKIEPALKEVISRDLNVRQTEKLVELLNSADEEEEEKPARQKQNHYYAETELALKEHLGRGVKIKGKDGKGTLTFEFYSDEDLTALANRLSEVLNEGE